MIYKTFRYPYCSVHRLHSEQLSPEENARVYGKCNNPNGHGHEYVIQITVAGPGPGRYGEIISAREMDELVRRHVAPLFDHQNVNITFGPGFISSGENLCLRVRDILQSILGVRLHGVGLIETPKNSFACGAGPA